MLLDPGAVLIKAKNYAKYDLVQVVNEFLDASGLNDSFFERIINKFLAVPARTLSVDEAIGEPIGF